MLKLVTRLGRKKQEPTWEKNIDTRLLRYHALDMALLNVQIGARNEDKQPGVTSGNSLRGDYLEFGVFEGNTFLHAHHRARAWMPWMRCFAFDSFEGLPAPKGVDAVGEFEAGQFSCSRDKFEEILRRNRADLSRIEIVPGWFSDSLTDDLKARKALKIASVAFIDCDLYESAVPVLDFLTGLVRQGSILLFDDWFNFRGDPSKGVRRATSEWLERNPAITLEAWHPFCHHGQSFIVSVRS